MVAVEAVPRRAINSRATAHAATLVAVVITEIVIMAIGVAVLSLAAVVVVVVDTVRAPEARLFAVVGKAIHIPTFRVVGDLMAVAGILVLERALWLPRASWPTPRVTGRKKKIGGTSLTLRLLGSRFRISPGLGVQFQLQDAR
jgi:hypothetical protein